MTIPKGLCQCGCGEQTNLVTQSNAKRGLVRGEPRQFLPGHATREAPAVLNCQHCGDPFEVRAATLRYRRKRDGESVFRFCSRECWDKARVAPSAENYGERACKTCGLAKPANRQHFEAHAHGRDGLHPSCRDCVNARKRERIAAVRKDILAHYSGGTLQCACCGEGTYEFLALDHIGGWGAKQRREVGRSHQIYSWIKRNDFPDGYRVLCHNCNSAIGYYGECPHETARKAKARLSA